MPRTGYQCVSGYQPAQIPNITTLAQHFAISDHTFSLADCPPGPATWTWSRRPRTASSATTRSRPKGVAPGPGWGCDSNRVTPWIAPNGRTEQVPSCVPAHLPGCGSAGRSSRRRSRPSPRSWTASTPPGLSWKLYGANRNQNGYVWSICPTFAECLDTSQDANLVPDEQFLTAAAAGALPSFSVVTPGGPDFATAATTG